MSTPSEDWQRRMELIELAAQEGITLPMPVDDILALEDQGHTVDLVTGEVTRNGANQASGEPTVWGLTNLLDGGDE